MHFIRLNGPNYDHLRTDPQFLLAIQLSRLLNVLRSNHRHYLRVPDDDDPANQRDRLELILYHASIVYESLGSLLRLSAPLSRVAAWAARADAVSRLQHEWNDAGSFSNKHLKPIRNGLLFHYDLDPLTKILESYPLTSSTAFAQSSTERTIDLAFTLADELVINSIVDTMVGDAPGRTKWAQFQDLLLRLSADVVDVIQDLMMEILRDRAFIESPD